VLSQDVRTGRGTLQKSVFAIPLPTTVDIFVPAPNHPFTSLLDSVGYTADSYYMSMFYGEDWPDESNICARGGGDKG
jgi:hypothetical protein